MIYTILMVWHKRKLTDMAQTPINNQANNNSGSGSKNSEKKSAGSSILKLLIVCAIAFAAFHFYTEWVHKESVESADKLRAELLQTTSQFKNADGYVDEASIEAYQDAAYACIQNYKGGRVKSKGKTADGVWVKFDDGMTMFANPPMEDYLSNDVSSKCIINTYKPHTFSPQCDPYVAMVDGNAEIYASQFTNAQIKSASYNDVTLAAIKSMGTSKTQQIVLWFGHGCYDSEDGSYLQLAETVNWSRLKTDADYFEDFGEGLIAYEVESGQVAINAEFIKKHVKNLDGALVYLGSCESGYDNRLANAFIDADAETVIGYNKKTRVTYHAELSKAFAQAMCTRDANGKYPSVSQAMATATSQVGADDSVKGGVGSKPVIFGNKSYAFQDKNAARSSATTQSSASSSQNANSNADTNANSSSASPANSNSSSGNKSNGSSTTSSNSSTNGSAVVPPASSTNSAGNGNDAQTAPMPDKPVTEDQLIGSWSPDINEKEPEIIEFFIENGQLQYYYYRLVLGNGSGFNTANEKTEFEYNSGLVHLQGNQGTCICLVGDSNKGYISFYLFDIDDGVIVDQEDGTPFYRVS
ncbi:MAG: hypothetical protein IJF97_09065 [Eggerthellaceae bacterium]|nr:hypothetical protein [Eggerthellaceae bacterium]